MHNQISLDGELLGELTSKTAIVTGGAGGIGAATVKLLSSKGANVVLADLESSRSAAESLISGLSKPDKALFVPCNILDWPQMNDAFKSAISVFGRVDIVVANAGTMESKMVLDLDDDHEDGEPKEPTEAYRVIDINLKGTLNTLKLGLHYLAKTSTAQSPGSIVLVSSTSGYFGGTGVTAYVASKHGVVGLLRSAQVEAKKRHVRVNGVAPFFTPTAITAAYSQRWREKGLEANTPDNVAGAIAHTAVDRTLMGACVLTAGKYMRELEHTRAAMIPDWIGEDLAGLFASGMQFFEEIGGYPLPRL
ncbi:uncharacterized protein HMPREF1541_05619 [Cyphellophora europaea CBS 101466]|uniref:Uncharacterized protein n=1 Tax=Cyphellophora europaea (strain CBS 101466) TaxID=1220924 RepID=W2RSC9_CYPE1|nr:uncharacterized protein HMPREF1541_05619 [Cyphellophora europaea CBS 101466]ETN39396.1 hypothetical protein HMPREF1541_05619 [Cyphellophora europaea CBS 101466]